MKVSLNGYGESVTTFEAEDSVRAGYPVKMTGMKVGILKLGATSDKAEVSETGNECLVVDIDSESSTCGIIL